MTRRVCQFRRLGEPCGSPPLIEGDLCLMHDPEHAEMVAEARKLGGSRRKRERTLAIAYDFEGSTTIEQIQRIVDIAMLDTLALNNSVDRNRALAYLAQTAAKLLELGKYGEQLAALRATLEPRLFEVKRQ